MGSEFRKKKIAHIFSFFDRDKSMQIEKKDFELSVETVAQRRGWQPSDPKYKEVEDTLMKIWDSLQKHADKDNSGQISFVEWAAMWEEFAKNPSAPLEWQNMYCKYIFGVQDASGDGVIDAEEFSTVLESFGLNKSDCVTAFQKMAKGKSTVSWEEFQQLWTEYFTSEDPDAPGNYIFGSTCQYKCC